MFREAKEDLQDIIYIVSKQMAVSSTFSVSSHAQKPSRNHQPSPKTIVCEEPAIIIIACLWTLGLPWLKDWHRIFDVPVNLSAHCALEVQTGNNESALVLTQENKKMVSPWPCPIQESNPWPRDLQSIALANQPWTPFYCDSLRLAGMTVFDQLWLFWSWNLGFCGLLIAWFFKLYVWVVYLTYHLITCGRHL